MPVTFETLNMWPVKGMAACADQQSLTISPDGLFLDRGYMLVEAAEHTLPRGKVVPKGRFLAMRNDPTEVRFAPQITESGLLVSHPSQPEGLEVPVAEDIAANRIPVSVWGWEGFAVDQGGKAADWHSNILGRPVRLVGVSKKLPRHPEDQSDLGVMGFADSYPITVITDTSRDLVNAELVEAGHAPISVLRPRSNIVLSGVELPNAKDLPENVFPEDFIDEIHIASNGLTVVLKRAKACGRCPVPDTNEKTGVVEGAHVRQALGRLGRRGYHKDPRHGDGPELMWSENFVIKMPDGAPADEPLSIQKGAKVEVVYSAEPNWQSERPAA